MLVVRFGNLRLLLYVDVNKMYARFAHVVLYINPVDGRYKLTVGAALNSDFGKPQQPSV